MKNIWQKVSRKKVFFCLAPMSDITDIAFRQIIAKYSKHKKVCDNKYKTLNTNKNGPDIFWTEFVSADGLASKDGRKKLLPILKFSKKEKPIIAQIFGAKPENIKTACEIISKLNFDGIDINMGCPDKSVVKQGAGSALIKNPKLAQEIIRSAKIGAPRLPISVKTRIGYNHIEYKTWLPKILKENISALTIHLRTKKEMSNVPAHFELIKDIVKVIRKYDKKVFIIINGDIKSLEQGKKLAKDARFDGIMIGRAIFGNPWFFNSEIKSENISIKEKLKVLIEHTKLYEKLLNYRNFANMKKHFKSYLNNFEGVKELRNKLMKTNNSEEVIRIIEDYLKNI
ncbi:MAG: tRNA-dihydrouridine synthase [bacterium]